MDAITVRYGLLHDRLKKKLMKAWGRIKDHQK